MINFADRKEWAKCRKQLTQKRLMKNYEFGIATHYACDNRIVHISKKRLLNENIKLNLVKDTGCMYLRYLNDGTITYEKFREKEKAS